LYKRSFVFQRRIGLVFIPLDVLSLPQFSRLCKRHRP